MTAGCYYTNLESSIQDRTDFSLRLAQQTATQVDNLTAHGRDTLDPTPLETAIRSMAVGAEYRPIQIASLKPGMSAEVRESEQYKLNEKTGAFKYVRIFNRDRNEGVRVHIQTGYIGYLGAKTVFLNDLYLLTTFILSFSLLLQLLGKPNRARRHGDIQAEQVSAHQESQLDRSFENASLEIMTMSVPEKTVQADEGLVKMAEWWVEEAKANLLEAGVNFRNMTKEAHSLTLAAAESRKKIESLSQVTIHTREAAEAASALLSDEKHLEPLREKIVALNALAATSALETESALHYYDDVFQVTRDLTQHISKTKQSLLSEAKMIQKLKEKVAAHR